MSNTKKEVIDILVKDDLDKLKKGHSWRFDDNPHTFNNPDILDKIIKKTKNPNFSFMELLDDRENPKRTSQVKFLDVLLKNNRDLYQESQYERYLFYNMPSYKSVPPSINISSKVTVCDAANFFSVPLPLFKMVADKMDKNKSVAHWHKNGIKKTISPFEFAILSAKPSYAYALMQKKFPVTISEHHSTRCVEMFFSACANLAREGKSITHPWQIVSSSIKEQYPALYDKELEEFTKFFDLLNDKKNNTRTIYDFLDGKTTKKVKKQINKNIVIDDKAPLNELKKQLVKSILKNNFKKSDALIKVIKDKDESFNLDSFQKNYNKNKDMPLILALSINNNKEGVYYLLKKGVDPNTYINNINNGWAEEISPLFFLIISNDLKYNYYSHHYESLSSTARLRVPMNDKSKKVISLLLSKVDVNQKDKNGKSIVEHLYNSNLTVDMMDILYKKDFDFSGVEFTSNKIKNDYRKAFDSVLKYYKDLSVKSQLKKEVNKSMGKKIKSRMI